MNEQSLTRRSTDDARQFLATQVREPFARLRDELDQMFNDFPPRWPALQGASKLAASMPVPAVEMTENEDSYRVSVEVPGIDPEDIDLSVQQDMLVVKGEKREEFSESERDFTRSERSYGAFERHITLPADAKSEEIEASNKNGVITIDIPRDKENNAGARKIPIGSA